MLATISLAVAVQFDGQRGGLVCFLAVYLLWCRQLFRAECVFRCGSLLSVCGQSDCGKKKGSRKYRESFDLGHIFLTPGSRNDIYSDGYIVQDTAGQDKDVKDGMVMPYALPRKKDDPERVRDPAGYDQDEWCHTDGIK